MYIPVLNKILRSVQKDYPGKLLYYPSKISIETGNVCNLRCPLCPTASDEGKDVAKGFMSFDDFRTAFDKIKPFVKTLDLFSWGEPFLNRDIGRMIEYAKKEKPGLRIFIDSNLNCVTGDQIDAVVRHGLDVLKVSCDGVTQETYEKYRIGGSVKEVMGNIERILDKEKELGSDKPRLIWKYLVFKHNQHEAEKAREKAREMGIGFEVSGMRVDCGKEIFEKVEDSVQRDRDWIPDAPEYNNYGDLEKGKGSCGKPWRTLTINWNGDVVPCGAIYDCAKYSFGNLFTQGFDEVWNSERFIEARKVIAGKAPADESLICSICKDNGYQFF